MMQAYEKLEQELSTWSGMDCVVCSSGTAALHLALEVMQLKGEVLVPDYTMVACARAVTLAGLTPVFVDCNAEDLLIDVGLLHGGGVFPLTTSAIMPVHVYGRRCDMNRVYEFAWVNKLKIVEDLAEAHGVRPHPATDAACWSFYRNKIVAGEEGGAVGFREPERAAFARQLRSLGFTEAHDYTHRARGHNYRLANCLAEKVSSSLLNMEYNVDRRRGIERWYDRFCPSEWKQPERQAPWVYDIRIPGLTSIQQDRAIHQLNQRGIAARHGFKPMSVQEEYKHCRRVTRVLGVSEAERASREVIYLPMQPGQASGMEQESFQIIQGVLGGDL